MRILIVYGTTDGMTGRIAERMAQTLRAAGHEVTLAEARASDPALDPTGHDLTLVGASLHAGGYQRNVRRYVEAHLAALNARPSAFFSVCLAIVSRFPRDREEARRIANALPVSLGWKPVAVEVIAGALLFSRYGFFRRWALTRIARKEIGDVDTTRDHVYTHWHGVDRFVLGLTGEPGRAQPVGDSFRV